MRRLEIVALLAVLVVVLGTPAAALGYEALLRSQTANEYTLIAYAPEGGNWSPSTIRVKQGERVRLRLSSADVAHGLAIPGLNVSVKEIYPGKFTVVEFVADKPGTYPFVCTVLCSPQHGGMKGEIIVEGTGASAQAAATPPEPPKAETPTAEALKAEVPTAEAPKAEAPKPEGSAEDVAQGQKVYQGNCGGCHGLRGEGLVGPALAGVPKDRALPMIRQGKGMMPAFGSGQISDADLEKLVEFIESLGNK